MIENLLVHGWGCNQKIWPLVKANTFDRGYFGDPKPFIECKRLVTHSFGLHLVPVEYFKNVQELTILSGFVSFSSKKRILEKMLKKLEENPHQLLLDFHASANSSFEIPFGINKILLIEDLKSMCDRILDLNTINHILTINIVHGRKDPITPFIWGEELHKKLPNSRFFPFEGGHFESIQEAHRLGLF